MWLFVAKLNSFSLTLATAIYICRHHWFSPKVEVQFSLFFFATMRVMLTRQEQDQDISVKDA